MQLPKATMLAQRSMWNSNPMRKPFMPSILGSKGSQIPKGLCAKEPPCHTLEHPISLWHPTPMLTSFQARLDQN